MTKFKIRVDSDEVPLVVVARTPQDALRRVAEEQQEMGRLRPFTLTVTEGPDTGRRRTIA